MTKKQIREEMKLRIQVVATSAMLAVVDINKGDFSQISKLLDDMEMYTKRARMDHEAAYEAPDV